MSVQWNQTRPSRTERMAAQAVAAVEAKLKRKAAEREEKDRKRQAKEAKQAKKAITAGPTAAHYTAAGIFVPATSGVVAVAGPAAGAGAAKPPPSLKKEFEETKIGKDGKEMTRKQFFMEYGPAHFMEEWDRAKPGKWDCPEPEMDPGAQTTHAYCSGVPNTASYYDGERQFVFGLSLDPDARIAQRKTLELYKRYRADEIGVLQGVFVTFQGRERELLQKARLRFAAVWAGQRGDRVKIRDLDCEGWRPGRIVKPGEMGEPHQVRCDGSSRHFTYQQCIFEDPERSAMEAARWAVADGDPGAIAPPGMDASEQSKYHGKDRPSFRAPAPPKQAAQAAPTPAATQKPKKKAPAPIGGPAPLAPAGFKVVRVQTPAGLVTSICPADQKDEVEEAEA